MVQRSRTWTVIHVPRNIISNVLTNTLKFTEDGSLTVRVSRSKAVALIVISDTGIGMSLDLVPFVFERLR